MQKKATLRLQHHPLHVKQQQQQLQQQNLV
jgi:hypothetical protein